MSQKKSNQNCKLADNAPFTKLDYCYNISFKEKLFNNNLSIIKANY